jgi:hypothetical protein
MLISLPEKGKKYKCIQRIEQSAETSNSCSLTMRCKVPSNFLFPIVYKSKKNNLEIISKVIYLRPVFQQLKSET